jgi:hypothetical protein
MSCTRIKAAVAVAATGLAVAACASVFDGQAQQIFVSTNPPGAECGLYREFGAKIATIESTPAQALIQKTKNDLFIVCVKSGYQQAMVRDHSGVAGAAFINIIGGVFTLGISTAIGVAVDSSNGSDNKYDSPVILSMIPNTPDQPEGPTVLPQIFDGAPQATTSPAGTEQPALHGKNHQISTSAPSPSSSTPPPVTAGPALTAGPSLSAGVWLCGIDNIGNKSDPRYTLQFNIGSDNAITVTSYNGAPATIVQREPLIFTALNPRGSRQIKFTWRSDNSMIVTGPNTNDPNRYFYNQGTCTKAS